mgnify:CR=1 FL=1
MKKWIKNLVVFCFILFISISFSCCKQEQDSLAAPPVPMKTITETCGEDTLTLDIPEDWKVLSCSETGIDIIPSEISDYTIQDTITISRYAFDGEENKAIELLLQGQPELYQTQLEDAFEVRGRKYSVENFSLSFDKLENRTLAKFRFDMVVPEKEYVVYPYIECYLDDIPYAVYGIQNDSLSVSPDILIPWIARSIKITE